MIRQQGITLVEVALSLVIAGVLMAGAMALNQRARAQRQYESTYDNMDTIIQALSVYVETAGRLPCPADPAASDVTIGWERGVKPADLQVAAGHFPAGSCDQKTREGIVPFMTLGLPAQTAMDGWGHFYTYAVSPVFTRQNDQSSAAADTGRVHGRCRHAGWVNAFDRYNRNAIKARFCCADQATPTFDVDSDLIILHTAGGAALSPVRTPGNMGSYDDITKTTTTLMSGTNVPVMDASPVEAPALVLISHGRDGNGAWLGNGTNNRLDPPESGPELQNADGDQVLSMVRGI
jgi:type II secretory pathway pseudopilin PulG